MHPPYPARRPSVRARLAALLVPLLLLGALALPAAPARAFLMMSAQEEAQLGAQEHPKIIAEFGGVYDDPEIGYWVAQVGGRLVRQTEMADQPFTFTVLDSAQVNAFALPGGYVYVTRGLLALMNTEAELAGVLGHEIGHVRAHHTAQRTSRANVANLLLGVLGAATGSEAVTQIGGLVGAGLLAQYSQDQEYEADKLGVENMAAAGWNPLAQADLLSSLLREGQLAQEIAGSGGANPMQAFFASHPNTLSRVERAHAQALATGAGALPYRREELLRHVDGMVWGDTPAQGMVRGREFLHPVEHFAFTAPSGFRLINQPSAVLARDGDGGQMVFDIAAKPESSDPYTYLTRQWAKQGKLSDAGRIEVNGMPGATAATQLQTQSGTLSARLVVIRHPGGKLYRMLFAAPPDRFAGYRTAFERCTYSFRRLPEAEARRLKPLRIRVVQAGSGASAASLAQRMAVADFPERRFRVLNALEQGQEPQPGERVKLIVDP